MGKLALAAVRTMARLLDVLAQLRLVALRVFHNHSLAGTSHRWMSDGCGAPSFCDVHVGSLSQKMPK